MTIQHAVYAIFPARGHYGSMHQVEAVATGLTWEQARKRARGNERVVVESRSVVQGSDLDRIPTAKGPDATE